MVGLCVNPSRCGGASGRRLGPLAKFGQGKERGATLSRRWLCVRRQASGFRGESRSATAELMMVLKVCNIPELAT